MRKIKFRGKEIETGEWKYGFYTQGKLIDPMTGDEEVRHIIDADYLFDVVPETVEQFTGLLDVYGEEVYEGDIVILSGSVKWNARVVVYYEEAFNIATRKEYDCLQKDEHPYFNDYAHMTCLNEWSNTGLIRVVGNIHDTPSLLFEKQ